MRRILFEIPLPGDRAIPIYSYGVMLLIGFVVALLLAQRRARRVGINPAYLVDVGLIALCAGVFGSRLFYVLQNFGSYFGPEGRGFIAALNISEGGLVYYGGFIAGTLGVILYARGRGIDLWQLLDVIAPSVMLGLAFGRMGCYLNGCCYGRPTESGWGVVFPPESFVYLEHENIPPGAPLHPTQIYSAVVAVILFMILEVAFDKRKRVGSVTALTCILYPAARFTIEFFRMDTAVERGLTASQNVSVLVALAGIGAMVYLKTRKEATPAEPSRSQRRAEERHKHKSKRTQK